MNSSHQLTPAAVLRHAAFAGDLRCVRHLVAEGVDVNIWEHDGCSALTYASRAGHLEVVLFLLANGAWAEPHEDYDTYCTPLMEAVCYGHLEIVKALVEAGAQPEWHVGVAQMTAECYARHYSQPEILAYLVDVIAQREKGANS